MTRHTFKINAGQAELHFQPSGGGFPVAVLTRWPDGSLQKIVNLRQSPFSITVAKQTYFPFCGPETPVKRSRRNNTWQVAYDRLPWRNDCGETLPGLHLSLNWEIHPDGAVFCDLFLFYATLEVPLLQDFRLTIPIDFSDVEELRWSLIRHPQKIDATLIQAASPERFLPRQQSRIFADELFAMAGFYALRGAKPACCSEFFLEGNNSLFNRSLKDTSSSVTSTPEGFLLTWNFQKNPLPGNSRPLHWRNRFGFLIRPAQTSRRHPPLSMYQYIDNFDRLPDTGQIRALAEAGAQVLILHDCWRFDTQNGGIPYDCRKFQKIVQKLHENGIRVVLYARGNEISVREDAAAWFDRWLKKDYDGIYLDYGGPLGYQAAPCENFPGGRVAFREYYHCMAALRKRVGEKGLLFFHTGTGFSALGASFMDGYTSGEGERGILVSGRLEHEYFSMAAASPGAMWTAAFPEYSSEKMTPFLAAAAQAPHLPIGQQIASSSLHHPPVPGFNDRHFRELLYAWSLLDQSKPCQCYTDYNSKGLFALMDPPQTGHCLLFQPGRNACGVLLLANCSDQPVTASFALAGAYANYQRFRIPGQREPALIQQLAPWEITAALLAGSPETAHTILNRHPRNNIEYGRQAKEYLKRLQFQKQLRELPPAADFHIRFFLPSRITSHEQSLWEDLYDIVAELREKLPGGQTRRLGFVSLQGLSPDIPPEDDRIRPGLHSAGFSLRQFAGVGSHELELLSTQHGLPFYSFLGIDIDPGGQLEFCNELEPDRSILHWISHIR